MTESELSLHGRSIRVLIVADVRLHREGLAACLQTYANLVVAGTLAGRAEVLQRIDELAPDVVLVDAAMLDGLELMRDLQRRGAAAKTIAVAVDNVTADSDDCEEAGASGYMAADASVEELVITIERVARGIAAPK
jgi:two-component system, NarL family, nitrate/nitrite response regulator NarL